jgi:hypothetical protein
MDLDVCVLHAGCSDELWRFSTSTLGWEQVDAPYGAVPRGRQGHVMTSVRLDLWLHGGVTNSNGEGDG